MQDLSFPFQEPLFTFGNLTFSVQIFTFENVYGLDETKCVTQPEDHEFILRCTGLTWAGGQETADGEVSLLVRQNDNQGAAFSLRVRHTQTVRGVKITFKNIEDGAIVNLRETPSKQIPSEGLILHYPEGWRNLYTPLVILKKSDGHYRYFRSLDNRVREKRFVFIRHNNCLDVELIFENLATEPSSDVEVPVWEVGLCAEPSDIMQAHQAHIEHAYNLPLWTERTDVPVWSKQISLIAAIHGQHFTGYIFNDYAKMLRDIEWLCKHIPPEQLLVYIPGWEGRYYWQYGDYRPDTRMGGEAGFAYLVKTARSMGVHIMPMFGINVVNRGTVNFEQWGAPAVQMSAGGATSSGSVDWDSTRHYDHSWGALLNPGSFGWQQRLSGQINNLIEKYGFDAVFLDITAAWWNDPHYPVFEGTRDLINRIKNDHPEVLIAGEGWYDAMSALTALVQSGHTEGIVHWHDEYNPDFFDCYTRSFGHLCLGDLGRGSTGVHELGTNSIQKLPMRKGIIPTLTLVENTLEVAQDAVLSVIGDAQNYAEQFLSVTIASGNITNGT